MSVRKLFLRFFIIIFWVLLIFGILYFPSWDLFPHEEKTLNIFTWGDVLDPEVCAQFEKKTGIKIHLNYFSSNEELIVKLKATGGEGYDLIVPSDYAVPILQQANLLKTLDRSKIPFFQNINPLLLGHDFDPQNQYSIPFEWIVYGLGVNFKFFQENSFIPSWKYIFDKNVINYKITMNNDPIEVVLLTGFYLFGQTNVINEQEFFAVRNLLFAQRKWVEAYVDFRASYFLATGNCPMAVTTSDFLWQTRKLFPHIKFMIPEEGSFISIENFCIPKNSKNETYIYQLLDFLYSDESLKTHYNTFGLFPATLSAMNELEVEEYHRPILEMTEEEFEKLHFFRNILPQQQVRDLWVEVKSF